jgi:hypothetical protein
MKLGSPWALVAILAVATTSIVPLSGFAQASPAGANIPAPTSPAPLTNGALSLSGTWAPTTVPFEVGPRETLAQCMGYWDSGTHMSKVEWRRACQRTQDGTRF